MKNNNEAMKKLIELQKELENLSGKIAMFTREYVPRDEAAEKLIERNEKKVVTDYLMRLGMSPSLLGFKYSRAAIIILLNNKQEERLYVTKMLYPGIARQFNTTDGRVERAIRHAVNSVCAKNRGENELVAEMLLNTNESCPTNSEFLAFIAEKIRLES